MAPYTSRERSGTRRERARDRDSDAAPVELARSEPPEDHFAIAELIRATGASAATIHHYVSFGLLPAPFKTAQNMAYYAPECIERLKVIRELREREIPLATIRLLMAEHGVTGARELIDHASPLDVVALSVLAGEERRASPADLVERTGLTAGDLEELEKINIARRDVDGSYDSLTVSIAECLSRLRQAGMTEEVGFHPADLILYREAMVELVRSELEYFEARAFGQVPEERVLDVMSAALEHAEVLAALVHRRALRDALEEAGNGSSGPQGWPSGTAVASRKTTTC